MHSSYDCETSDARLAHRLMYGLIVPRPIAWVSTRARNGRDNLAPFSFFNAVSGTPPILMFAISRPAEGEAISHKDTLANILETQVFVVNIVSPGAASQMASTAERVAANVDEFSHAGVTKSPADKMLVSRVADAQANLECVLHHHCDIGEATAVFGRVVMAHVAPGLTNDGYINTEKLNPIARIAGNGYASVTPVSKQSTS
ncbi:flavin reductase family protein [Sulfitobacter sp. F26204]|uniref:flavin reductase family protein n=1 Tax=Sulfitobacter sp. F26204 TaxID=2996014 RepID=UPI00225E56C4|nr:flavin reductase family protein [Sulfitobacter sp. F26204]MCX7561453.1 flavin reductase family protein [Sulfitobacter sp. F26204]